MKETELLSKLKRIEVQLEQLMAMHKHMAMRVMKLEDVKKEHAPPPVPNAD